jgi:hypothetical protein
VLRAGLRDEDPAIEEQEPRLERPRRNRVQREREIEQPALDVLEQVEIGERLVDLDADVRVEVAVARDDLGKESRPDALEGTDVELSARPVGKGVDLRLGRVQARLDRAHMPEEDPPGLGEPHRLASVLSRDHLYPDHALEPGDLLTDCRRRVPENARRALERSLVRDRAQRRQVPEVEPDPLVGHGRDQGSVGRSRATPLPQGMPAKRWAPRAGGSSM